MAELDYDLLNFDAFFAPNNDEGVDDLWALAATSSVGHEDDLLDTVELEPLSPMKEDPPEEVEVQVKQEPSIKLGLKIDTKLSGSSKDGWLAQYENAKSNGTPTATLPARFALLSTTCVYEPGFTTSPRGKRRIKHGDDEPFMMAGDDYGLPVFTDEEFSAMIESPSKVSSTSTNSPTPSPLRGPNDATTIDPGSLSEHEIPDVINMFNAMYDNSHKPRYHPTF
ncbi:hypothetical protein PHMEG_00026511 [Phytophthora megakarya]|uniref:Uncharacterized protein n=1 Tax=Phytophthora megakarya TaxID=4795 RepID=A0A225VBZ8_9STRA|nr:hypothetical protein PHMEG_00026511 [Phytophthora megakarya]